MVTELCSIKFHKVYSLTSLSFFFFFLDHIYFKNKIHKRIVTYNVHFNSYSPVITLPTCTDFTNNGADLRSITLCLHVFINKGVFIKMFLFAFFNTYIFLYSQPLFKYDLVLIHI